MTSITKKVGKRGEIVLPKRIRKEKGIEANTEVAIISTKEGVALIPLKKKFKDLTGLFGDEKIDHKKLDIAAQEYWAGIL